MESNHIPASLSADRYISINLFKVRVNRKVLGLRASYCYIVANINEIAQGTNHGVSGIFFKPFKNTKTSFKH